MNLIGERFGLGVAAKSFEEEVNSSNSKSQQRTTYVSGSQSTEKPLKSTFAKFHHQSTKVDLLGQGFGLGVAAEGFEEEVNRSNSKS